MLNTSTSRALSNLAGQTICDAMYVQLDAKLYNRVHKLHEFLYMQFTSGVRPWRPTLD